MLKKSSFEKKIKFTFPKSCHPTSGVDTEPKVLFGRPYVGVNVWLEKPTHPTIPMISVHGYFAANKNNI